MLDTDLSEIEFHHPISNIERDIERNNSNLVIENDFKIKTYPNNKWYIIYNKHLSNIINI